MVKELITMDMSIESVYHDYKLVADSIVDDKSFQNADTGILLSNLYDVVKVLEKQIPKAPINKTKPDNGVATKYENCNIVTCPACKGRLKLKSKGNYCDKCGQAIKWE